ncbi:uncharacterized protein LOC143818576 [Ranitomeya variabilis]|uniref:uncharacterized protein LOC143818576 n=1 Tax=Ranitomeya variabilis TaxID=490064 RepID=UPI004056A0CB
MKSPSMKSKLHCRRLLAWLDLLTVPLLQDSIPGIVKSSELGKMKTLTSVLTEHLHDLDGQDLVNALLFLSSITSARADADTFLNSELIDKTYNHMLKAKSEKRQGITGTAMTLLANIAVYRYEEVMERLEIDDEHTHSSALKILDLIYNKTNRYCNERKGGEQNILTVDYLITHTQHQAGPSESFDFCYHLLHPIYGFNNHQDDSDVLHDTDTTQAAMCHYITCVLTDEQRIKVIHCMLIAMSSGVRTSRLISVMFFSELLRHPELQEEDMAKDFIFLMASKMKSSDELEVCYAAQAMGNACKGAPREVHQLKDMIIESLCRKLSGYQKLNVVIKSLQALSKIVTLLKSSKIGRTYERIVSLCTDNLNNPDPLIQTYATSLFADLAENCNWNKRNFSHHVSIYLPDLLLKLHSKDEQVKACGIAALLHCIPYIGCKNAKELLNAGGVKSCQIYEHLGQKEPAYLVDMMIDTTELLYMVDDVDAVLKHLTMIRDALPYEELYPTALRDMFIGLRKLLKPLYPPEVQEASYRAMDILGTKWKSIGSAKVGTRSNTLLERVEIATR